MQNVFRRQAIALRKTILVGTGLEPVFGLVAEVEVADSSQPFYLVDRAKGW